MTYNYNLSGKVTIISYVLFIRKSHHTGRSTVAGPCLCIKPALNHLKLSLTQGLNSTYTEVSVGEGGVSPRTEYIKPRQFPSIEIFARDSFGQQNYVNWLPSMMRVNVNR